MSRHYERVRKDKPGAELGARSINELSHGSKSLIRPGTLRLFWTYARDQLQYRVSCTCSNVPQELRTTTEWRGDRNMRMFAAITQVMQEGVEAIVHEQ